MLRSVLLSAQRQLLCYFSENDFRDDGTEITGSFLFSPKLSWGDNYTLHENAEHILRSKYYFFPKEIAFDNLFSNLNPALPVDCIADVWGTSITSSPLKRSVLDCASACQVGGYFSGMIWRDNVITMSHVRCKMRGMASVTPSSSTTTPGSVTWLRWGGEKICYYIPACQSFGHSKV